MHHDSLLASSVQFFAQEMDDEAAYQAIRDNASEDEKPKMYNFLKKLQPEERKGYLQYLKPKELVDMLGLELGGYVCLPHEPSSKTYVLFIRSGLGNISDKDAQGKSCILEPTRRLHI